VALLAGVEEMRWEDLDWLLGINLGGVVTGTKAFLPQLRETGGHLVNVSSVFGLLGIPDQSAYSTAKFAVAGFTGAVREESRAKGWGVAVTCVHPGGVATPIAARARTADGVDPQALVRLFDRVARTSPDTAARAILAGAAAGHGRVLVGPDAHLLAVLTGVLPADTVHRILAAVGGQWPRSASDRAGSGVPSAPPPVTLGR
jgi:short-subunit dehydrogenase